MIKRGVVLTTVALLAVTGCTDARQQPEPVAARTPSTTADKTPDRPAVAVTHPSKPRGRAPTAAELIGTWKPVTLLGEDLRHVARVNGNRPTITFGEYGFGLGWTGYEGCNWTSGRFRIRGSGTFEMSQQASTARGCIGPGVDHVANVEVVTGAQRVLLAGDRLRFYARSGRLLGAYARTHPGL